MKNLWNVIKNSPTYAALLLYAFIGLGFNYVCNPDCGFVFKMSALQAVLPSLLVWFWIAMKNEAKIVPNYTAEEKARVLARTQPSKDGKEF
jgi:hypothetical protein